MPPVGFEPTISAGERPKTYALDRAATGTGRCITMHCSKNVKFGSLICGADLIHVGQTRSEFECGAHTVILSLNAATGRSQWPLRLRCRSSTTRLPRLWFRITPGAWMFVCCVLSGRGLCDVLITRPEESYRLWCVVV